MVFLLIKTESSIIISQIPGVLPIEVLSFAVFGVLFFLMQLEQ